MKRILPKLNHLLLFAATVFLLHSGPSGFAATQTWNGTGTDWNTIGNWNSAVPGTADTVLFNSTGNANPAISLAASGSAKSISFTSGAGAYTISGAGTLNLATAGSVSVDNLVTGAEAINNAITLGTGASAVTYALSSNSLNSANTLNFGAGIAGANTSTVTLTLNGVNSGLNTISGAISNGSSSALALTKDGSGTWVLGGNNTYTGVTRLVGGTVVLDYTTNTGLKLGGTTAMTLGGVNLQLSGGSGIETVVSGTTKLDGGGQLLISRSSGTQTINLGIVSQGFTSGGAVSATLVNFQTGVALTSSTTTNATSVATSILLGAASTTVGTTLGSYDWAAVDASHNIVGYSTVNTTAGTTNGFFTLAPTQNASTGGNFLVTDSVTTVQNGIGTLKIVTTSGAAQTLTLSGTMGLGAAGGILNSASGNYTITGGQINLGATGASFSQWGAGTLEIDSNIIAKAGSYFQKGGSGTLILGGTNAWPERFFIQQGAVSVGSDSNLGGASGSLAVASALTSSTNVTLVSAAPPTLVIGSSFLGSTIKTISGTAITLNANANADISSSTAVPYAIAPIIVLNGGTLEASASFSLSETGAAVQNRSIVLGNDTVNGGGAANAGNGGTIQVDSNATLTVPGVISGGGSLTKTGAGTLVLSASNSYSGVTQLNGGVLNVGVAQGASGPIGGSNTIFFGGGTLQYSAANTFDYSFRFNTGANQAISIDTNSQNVTFATGLSSSGGTLTKSGSGTLTLSVANTYTGATTVNGGTLLASGSLAGSTALTVNNAGSVLKLGASNLLKNTATLSLGVGTFDVNGKAQTLGALISLSGSSNILLSASTANLSFADSSSLSAGWTGTLTIQGWDAASLGAAGNNHLFFGNNASTLTAGQIAEISFLDPIIGGLTQTGFYSASLLPTGELVALAVPEPGTWGMLLSGFGMLLGIQRLRKNRVGTR